MIFAKDVEVYATVWKAQQFEKYIDLRISTSEKDKDGAYVNSNWFARAIGHAANSLRSVAERDRIKITTLKFTNEYNPETGNSYLKLLILEAQPIDQRTSQGEAQPEQPTDKSKKGGEAKKEDANEDSPW